MSAHDEIRAIVEEMLQAGTTDRDVIVEAASRNIDVDSEELRRVFFTKGVSWAISQLRDDNEQRVAYQIREGGKRLIVDVRHTNDAALIRKIGNMKIRKGTAEVKDGERLVALADQIEINFDAAA